MERNDCDLVRAAQAGDKAAFVDIVSRYQAMVTGITLGILKNFQSSEDAAQEVFITAWLKIAKIRDPSKLKAWLAQIARNTALTHLRKAPKSALLPLKEEAHTHSPDHTAASIEEHTLVLQELSQLPENLRLPLVLFYRENQSINNVAVSLGLSPEAVKKRLYRGRSALRDRVSKLLDPVLQRTRPGPLFTTAVASGIGAMMEPSAVAATAVTHTPATATKFSLSTTTLVVALAFPTGYGLHKTLENPSPTSPTIPSKTAPQFPLPVYFMTIQTLPWSPNGKLFEIVTSTAKTITQASFRKSSPCKILFNEKPSPHSASLNGLKLPRMKRLPS